MKIDVFLAPAVAFLVMHCGAAVEPPLDSGEEAQPIGCAPDVPPALAVPEGNEIAFSHDAVGVQIYTCQNTPTGYAWVFVAPEATLLKANGRPAGTHYVGPVWESKDGSKVTGAKLAEAASPAADAIPWLLLHATSHDGAGRMAKVTFIHRVDTAGGKAPAAGCDAAHAAATARVEYAATYHFYWAKR